VVERVTQIGKKPIPVQQRNLRAGKSAALHYFDTFFENTYRAPSQIQIG
jgi:hypothetical protein